MSIPTSTRSAIACAAGGIVLAGARLKFWQRSRDPEEKVGTRRLKYRLPENPSILNSPHTSVRRKRIGRGLYICQSCTMNVR